MKDGYTGKGNVLWNVGAMAVIMSLALLFVADALAQDKPPLECQPDCMDIGVVYVGAIADASVLVFAAGDSLTGVDTSVSVPDFLEVTGSDLRTHTFGSAGTKICFDIDVTFSTRVAGNLEGVLAVTIADQSIEIPVKGEVRPVADGLRRILVIETPFEKYSGKDSALFEPWRELVRNHTISADYFSPTRLKDLDLIGDRLDNAHVVIVAESGLTGLRQDHMKRLRTFAENGGTVIVMADAFYRGTITAANMLIRPYGLKMVDEEFSPSLVEGDAIRSDALTEGVGNLFFFRVSATKDTKGDARILVKQPGVPDAGYIVAAPAGKGMMVVIGESLWWSWLKQGQENNADNGQLLLNLLTKSIAD